MKITKLQCPSCGGQLTINEKNPMVAVCKYCDTHIALEWENQQPYFTKDTSQNRSSYQTPEDLLSDLKKESNLFEPKRILGTFVVIFVCLFIISFISFLNAGQSSHSSDKYSSSWKDTASNSEAEPEPQPKVLSGNLGEFASSLFGLPVEDITETELSKIQWLEIKYEMNQKKIGYSFDAPDAENAELTWVSFSRESDLGQEHLCQFTGLKKLTMTGGNSIKEGELKGLSLESIGGYFYSPSQIAEIIEDASTLKEIQFLGGLDSLAGLEQFPNLETLSIGSSDLTDVDALRNLPKLTTLTLDGFDSLSDFSVFSTMNNLVSLTLNSENLKALNFLSGMTSLKELHIVDGKMLSLDGLEVRPELESFSVTTCYELQNMNAVTSLTNLKELSLDVPYGCEEPDLSNLTAMESLKLSDFNNCAFVTNMKQLKRLEFDGCYFSTPPNLSGLTSLKELVYHTSSSLGMDVRFITNISSLEKLDMGGISTYEDISGVFNMPNLKELKISGMECEIDFSQVKDNHTLERLYMNEIILYKNAKSYRDGAITYVDWDDVVLNENTAFLGHLKGLKHLSIQTNQLTDISFVTNLTMLETIDLTDNYVTEIRPLAELKNLKQVICTGNPITNKNVLSETVNLVFE